MSRGLPSPSSLRIALVDSCFYAALLAAVGLAMTALAAYSAEPVVEQQSETAAAKDAAQDKDKDIKFVGPQSDLHPTPVYDESDKTQALVLGMKLELQDDKDVIVSDVGATSPAWKAGVRRGDSVLALGGLKPTDFGQWLRDVTKVVKEKQAGQEVPMEVARNGTRVPMLIRVPESRVAEVLEARREMKENLAQLAGAPATVPSGQTLPANQTGGAGEGFVSAGAAGYRGSYGVGGFDWGVFGDDGTTAATNADDRMANRAIAQLFAAGVAGGGGNTNGAAMPRQPGRGQVDAPQGSAGQTAGGAVGIAAFQNSGQGVAAVVEVRGLPAGSYLAGVSEDNGMAGADRGPFQNVPRNGRLEPNPSQPPVTAPRGIDQGRSGGQNVSPTNPQNLPRENVDPTAPANAPNGPQPKPRTGTSLADPSGAAVLAQRLEAQPSPRAGGSGAAPVGGAADRAAVVANDRVRPAPSGSVPFPTNNGGAPQFVAQLGTLNVGPDGTARVQQQLDGMQVRNLVGTSVVIVSTVSQGGGGTMPAANGAVGANAGRNTSVSQKQPANNQDVRGAERNAAGVQNAGSIGGVVATGVIRLASEPGVSQPTQPNAADPNGVDAATRARAQQQRFEGTPPAATFDPTQPTPQK